MGFSLDSMNARELRRLTAEWVRQPKTQAYLNFLLKHAPDSSSSTWTEKVQVELAFKRFVLENGGVTPFSKGGTDGTAHVNSSFFTNEKQASSFFPHRLSFLSYWLLGFAAATASVSSGPLHKGTFSVPVDALGVDPGVTTYTPRPTKPAFFTNETETPNTTDFTSNQPTWNGFVKVSAERTPRTPFAKKDATSHSWNLPYPDNLWDVYEAAIIQEDGTLGETSFSNRKNPVNGSFALEKAEWLSDPSLRPQNFEETQFPDKAEFANVKTLLNTKLSTYQNPASDYRTAARSLDLWRQKLALQHPSFAEPWMEASSVHNTQPLFNVDAAGKDASRNKQEQPLHTAHLLRWSEKQLHVAEDQPILSAKNMQLLHTNHQPFLETEYVGRTSAEEVLGMQVQGRLNTDLRLLHPLCTSDVSGSSLQTIPALNPTEMKRTDAFMYGETGSPSVNIWPSMASSASRPFMKGQANQANKDSVHLLGKQVKKVMQPFSMKQEGETVQNGLPVFQPAWSFLRSEKTRFYRQWLRQYAQALEQFSFPAFSSTNRPERPALQKEISSVQNVRNWQTIASTKSVNHPDRRRGEKLFRVAFDNSPTGLRWISPSIERVRQRLKTYAFARQALLREATASFSNTSMKKQTGVSAKKDNVRWTANTWLNHRHMLAVRRPTLQAMQNQRDAFSTDVGYDASVAKGNRERLVTPVLALQKGSETHFNTLDRLLSRRGSKADRRASKSSKTGAGKPLRKRWQPRPAWLQAQRLKALWTARQAGEKSVLKPSFQHRHVPLSVRFSGEKNSFYGAPSASGMLNERTLLQWTNQPTSFFEENWLSTNASHYRLPSQKMKALRRRIGSDNSTPSKNAAQRTMERVTRRWNRLYAFSVKKKCAQLFALNQPWSYLKPFTKNTAKRLGQIRQTERAAFAKQNLWYVTFRGTFQDRGAVFSKTTDKNPASSKWLKAVHRAEYQRLVYERIQQHIHQMIESAVLTKETDFLQAQNRPKVGRAPLRTMRSNFFNKPNKPNKPGTSFAKGLESQRRKEPSAFPVNARHTGPTLQRAWALRREQERSVYMFLARQPKLAQTEDMTARLKAKKPRVVNAHSQTWRHTQRRSLRQANPWLRTTYRLQQNWASFAKPFTMDKTERQHPWRNKLLRARTKLDRLTRRVDQRSAFTRYLGPTSALWWDTIPSPALNLATAGFPTVKWAATDFGSNQSNHKNWTELCLVLVHVCALFSISSFPAVRDLFKFNAVLAYKLAQLYGEAYERLLGFYEHFNTHVTTAPDSGRVQGDEKMGKKVGITPSRLTRLTRLTAAVENTGNDTHVDQAVQKGRGETGMRFGPPLASWNQYSYWNSLLRLTYLGLSRAPYVYATNTLAKTRRLAWQGFNNTLLKVDQFNQWVSWWSIDPFPIVLDFIAYVFCLFWVADLPSWLPEQFDSRVTLASRKYSRPMVLWMSLAFGWSGTLMGSWLQRRAWSMAERWWALANQPDEDLLRRQRNSQLRLEVWTEVLMQAADVYGISLTVLRTEVEEQKRLVELLYADRDWSWFDPSRLPPSQADPALFHARKGVAVATDDAVWERWGSQPQLTHPLLHLETWVDAPPAQSLQSLLPSNPTGSSNEKSTALQTTLFSPKQTFQTERQNLWQGTLSGDALLGAGELICDVFAGLWQRRVAKNILVVGPSGPAKNLWVKALAGEMEVPLIQDSAHRYTDSTHGIRRLREVFDAVAWQAPCLFLLEDIHAIGHRRSESLVSTGIPQLDTRMLFGEVGDPEHVQNHNVHVFTRHALTHYGRPFRGDFSEHIAVHHFAFDLFSNPSSSAFRTDGKNADFNPSVYGVNVTEKRGRQGLTVKSPLPIDQLEVQKKAQLNNGHDSTDPSSVAENGKSPSHMTAVSRLKVKRPTPLKPAAASPLQLLALKAERTVQPLEVVPEWPLTGFSEEQQRNMTRVRQVIRTKVSVLAQQTLAPVSRDLDSLTDLLMILDGVRSQRGFVVLATTHAAHVLDPALRRPGRLDQTIHIGHDAQLRGANSSAKNEDLSATRWGIAGMLPSPVAEEATPQEGLVSSVSSRGAAFTIGDALGKQRSDVRTGSAKPFMPWWMQSVLSAKTAPSAPSLSSLDVLQAKKLPYNKQDRLRALAYGQIAERWMNWNLSSASADAKLLNVQRGADSVQQYAWLYASPVHVPSQVIPALAAQLGESLVMSETGRQSGLSFIHNEHWGSLSFTSENTPVKAQGMRRLHEVLTAWMDKRGLYATQVWNTRLWSLQNHESLFDPPSPPYSELKIPAKRYEHYRRIWHDLSDPSRAQSNWKTKLDLHENIRTGQLLYGKLPKNEFRSESMPGERTSFTSAFWQLSNLDTHVGGRSAIQRYVDRRLVERHLTYLTDQWWNAHLQEHRAEDTFLSDVDHRIQFIESLNEDMYMDFPDTEQYYSPRNRRWMLHDESWQYPDRWTEQGRSEFYRQMVLECTSRGYAWLDERREAVDSLAWTLLQKGRVYDLHLIYAWKRFVAS
jgi:hypothetical protein